jgi:hypothetical protein
MGIFCPVCNSWQPIVRNVTGDGGPSTASNPVLARVLKCGHTLGGKAHREFIEKCNEIRSEAFARKEAIDNEAQARMSALWEVISAPEAV